MAHIKVNIILFLFLFQIFFSGCKSERENIKAEVKNIVLIIGNSSVLTQFQTGNDYPILSKASFYRFPANKKGNYQTQNTNFSALAIGKTCTNNSVGLDSSGVAQPNLIELASVKGLSTGLITSGSSVQALPASFIAHLNHRNQYESIALEFLNSPFDFFIGAGLPFFIERKDSVNLLLQLEKKGYSVFTDLDKVRLSKKLAVFIDERESIFESGKTKPVLLKSTGLALKSLSDNPCGFLLIIDGTSISPAKNVNEMSILKTQIADFGKSIESAFNFATHHPGTLIIISSDHFAASRTNEKSVDLATDIKKIPNTAIPSDSAIIATFGVFPGSLEEISKSTGIFNKIVNLLNLDAL
jgi:alkaline phosphatase